MHASTKPLGELALWLRSQRQCSGLTYAQLAARTDVSATSLSRATKGERLPSLAVVEAFARGCSADSRKAVSLWRKARYAANQQPINGEQAPMRPEYIHNFSQLHTAVLELYRKAGSPPLRSLENTAAGQYGCLPRSSVSRVLRGQAIPRKELLLAFVRACATSGRIDVSVWQAAWERSSQHARYERSRRRSEDNASQEMQLRVSLRSTEQRLKELTKALQDHRSQRAEHLASYWAVADNNPWGSDRDSGMAEPWLEIGRSNERGRELMQRLVAADSAISAVEREMTKTQGYAAALRRRLEDTHGRRAQSQGGQ